MKTLAKDIRVQIWVDRICGARTQKVTIQVYDALLQLPNNLQKEIWDSANSQGVADGFWDAARRD